MFETTKTLRPSWLHVCIYGSTGTGKTQQAGHFPEPIFLMPKGDEGGILTLAGMDASYKVITSMADMLRTLDHLEGIQQKQGADKLPGQTLVLDSLSHYSDMCVEEIAQKRGGMDQQGWGQIATHFRSVQQQARRLSMHVVYCALADNTHDDTGKASGGRPLLQGRVKEMLPSACDIVTYLQARDGKPTIYRSHLKPFQGYYARSRFRQLPAEVILGADYNQSLWAQMEPHLFPSVAADSSAAT
jgi:hypothetical protein